MGMRNSRLRRLQQIGATRPARRDRPASRKWRLYALPAFDPRNGLFMSHRRRHPGARRPSGIADSRADRTAQARDSTLRSSGPNVAARAVESDLPTGGRVFSRRTAVAAPTLVRC